MRLRFSFCFACIVFDFFFGDKLFDKKDHQQWTINYLLVTPQICDLCDNLTVVAAAFADDILDYGERNRHGKANDANGDNALDSESI